jgi:hypothetical protein
MSFAVGDLRDSRKSTDWEKLDGYPCLAAMRCNGITRRQKNSSGAKRAEPPCTRDSGKPLIGDLVKIDSGTVFVDDGIHGWNGTDTITIIGTDNLK